MDHKERWINKTKTNKSKGRSASFSFRLPTSAFSQDITTTVVIDSILIILIIIVHHSPFIGPININRKFWKITPLDHGGPEMKCTNLHRNCWKKIAKNDRSHAMDISRNTKAILKNCQKIGKMTPLSVKNWIFKKCQNCSIPYGTRFSQPKYHIPRWKIVTGSLKTKKY